MDRILNKFHKNHNLFYKVVLFVVTTFLIVYLFPKVERSVIVLKKENLGNLKIYMPLFILQFKNLLRPLKKNGSKFQWNLLCFLK